MLMLLTQMVFFQEIPLFFNLAEKAYLEKTEPTFTSKTMICRKYSSQKLNNFSLGNNELDAPASNTGDFLLRDVCVPST
jgi:hypothetical protein